MPQTYETPPGKGGVRDDLLPSVSRSPLTLSELRMQMLATRFGLTSTRALALAPLVFGEVRHG